jgi:azurin
MKRLVLAAALILALPVAGSHLLAQPQAAAKPAAKAAGRVIDITGSDDMKFSVTAITAKPGELITIRLKNTGTIPKIAMGHNVVVLKKDADPAAFTTAATTARDTDYIPASMKDKIVANTTLTGPGETAEVTFKAPAAGTYPYLCSFPGHYAAGMKGTLTVK